MRAVDSLFPRVLALAVVSSAMVSLGIGTGFERHYKVLKRLGATPLGRPRLVAGKVAAVAVTLALQLLVLTGTAVALGWRPGRFGAAPVPQLLLTLAACGLGTAAFAGIGLTLAGRLPGLVNLAATNALYLVLLLAGGIAVPLAELPGPMASAGRALPTGALVDVLVDAVVVGEPGSWAAWAVLGAWAVATPALAALTFRWE
jgi:ABC-2 type transport system permease protein